MLAPADKDRLLRYLDFLDSELNDFSKFSKTDWKTYNTNRDLRRNIERWIENLINCSIDLAKVLLLVEEQKIPQTYKDILKELGTTPYFDEAFGESLARWAVLRNILAHEYLDIRWKTIKGFLNSAEPLFRRLSDTIKTKVLDKCPPSLG